MSSRTRQSSRVATSAVARAPRSPRPRPVDEPYSKLREDAVKSAYPAARPPARAGARSSRRRPDAAPGGSDEVAQLPPGFGAVEHAIGRRQARTRSWCGGSSSPRRALIRRVPRTVLVGRFARSPVPAARQRDLAGDQAMPVAEAARRSPPPRPRAPRSVRPALTDVLELGAHHGASATPRRRCVGRTPTTCDAAASDDRPARSRWNEERSSAADDRVAVEGQRASARAAAPSEPLGALVVRARRRSSGRSRPQRPRTPGDPWSGGRPRPFRTPPGSKRRSVRKRSVAASTAPCDAFARRARASEAVEVEPAQVGAEARSVTSSARSAVSSVRPRRRRRGSGLRSTGRARRAPRARPTSPGLYDRARRAASTSTRRSHRPSPSAQAERSRGRERQGQRRAEIEDRSRHPDR